MQIVFSPSSFCTLTIVMMNIGWYVDDDSEYDQSLCTTTTVMMMFVDFAPAERPVACLLAFLPNPQLDAAWPLVKWALRLQEQIHLKLQTGTLALENFHLNIHFELDKDTFAWKLKLLLIRAMPESKQLSFSDDYPKRWWWKLLSVMTSMILMTLNWWYR